MLKFSGSSCLIGDPNESWGAVRPQERRRPARGSSVARGRVESRIAEATRRQQLCVRRGSSKAGRFRSSAWVHSELALRNTHSPSPPPPPPPPPPRRALPPSFPGGERRRPSDDAADGRWRWWWWGRVGSTDTPTSMLPGVSRKRKMRSKF